MALASYAMDVSLSRGRRYAEPPHPYRNDYARDRDRVIHSRAFRRLEAKTQVFTTRYSDHFRNRLTHTLEVAQIARTVAGALGLDTDLAEALALVHDIGHPPFGHAGEQRLDQLMRANGDRFDHNLHALRIVEQFEQRYLGFPGLNLTFEVREGIIKHSREYSAAEFPELAEYLLDLRPPLEAQLIDWVDEIAYNTADLDDGFEARLLDLEMIRGGVPAFAEAYAEVEGRHPAAGRDRAKLKLNEALKRVLDRLATDLIEHTRAQVRLSGVKTVEDVRRQPMRLAGFSPTAARQSGELKGFLYAKLYNQPTIAEDRERSVEALEQLFRYYLDHPEAMPEYYFAQAQSRLAGPPHRVVCDYIAGMTDHFLLRQHRKLLGDAPPTSTRAKQAG
ncbi:MAG TPA: deoxyguanosinetriphosphate triphosphohydrolase [Candidatus Acidoferrales bacterium]|nr:deoxyguanosinetriphosphate triphosphohydrolase [Candidatus Acidoferrales bacterium]